MRDFDRPLNARGERDAPRMAEVLAAKSFAPDALVSSPARRALATARILAPGLGLSEAAIREEARIYEADLATLRRIVSELPAVEEHVVMVGHNPGFHLLASALADDPVARLPTCAVCDLHFEVATWEEAAEGKGALEAFLYPKMLP